MHPFVNALIVLSIIGVLVTPIYFSVHKSGYQESEEGFVTAGEGGAYFFFLIGGLIAFSAFFMDGNAGQVVIPLGFGVAMLGTLILK